MSAENVEIVRRGYEAYARGDIDGAVADVAPDCRYTASGAVPGKIGVFEGPEGYKEFISWLRSEFDDADAQVDELIDAGDRVLVGATLTGRGKQSGIDARFTFWPRRGLQQQGKRPGSRRALGIRPRGDARSQRSGIGLMSTQPWCRLKAADPRSERPRSGSRGLSPPDWRVVAPQAATNETTRRN